MQKKYAILSVGSIKVNIILDDSFIYGIYWKKQQGFDQSLSLKQKSLLGLLRKQLEKYLQGNLEVFNVPFKLEGTEFQLKVWNELIKIPYGKTLSYKELALKLKNPNASRAVGTANSKNPISIIVPCHRVIRANGEYGGYAGGELTKASLLNLELEKLS